jgi:hypothetical protein
MRDGVPAFDPAHRPAVEPTLSVGCKIQLDCPRGFTCEFATGACAH